MDMPPISRVPLPADEAPDVAPDEPLEIVFVEDLQPARGPKARPRPATRRKSRRAKPPAGGITTRPTPQSGIGREREGEEG